MGYSIKVTEHAYNDLDQIVSYIVGELGNPSAALTLLTAVERVYEKLAETPNMYGLVPETAAFPARIQKSAHRRIPDDLQGG